MTHLSIPYSGILRRFAGTTTASIAVGLSAASAAFVATDVQFWTGADAGPGINESVLVIDWNDGGTSSSYAWGYRWAGTESRTGQDMIRAIADADPRLSIQGIETNFADDFSFSPGGGAPDLFASGAGVGFAQFWNYHVNNEVFNDPDDFTNNSHILPPNGEPYATSSPGTWISSSTGIADRPLADGSWDGWVFAAFGSGALPAEPIAASPIPEPGVPAILIFTGALTFMRRRRPVAGSVATGNTPI